MHQGVHRILIVLVHSLFQAQVGGERIFIPMLQVSMYNVRSIPRCGLRSYCSRYSQRNQQHGKENDYTTTSITSTTLASQAPRAAVVELPATRRHEAHEGGGGASRTRKGTDRSSKRRKTRGVSEDGYCSQGRARTMLRVNCELLPALYLHHVPETENIQILGGAYLDMDLHDLDRILDRVRDERDEDVASEQQQGLHENADPGETDEGAP